MNKLHIVYASLLSLIVVSNGMDAHSKQNNEVPPLSSDGLLKQKPNIAASTTIDQKATLPGELSQSTKQIIPRKMIENPRQRIKGNNSLLILKNSFNFKNKNFSQQKIFSFLILLNNYEKAKNFSQKYLFHN